MQLLTILTSEETGRPMTSHESVELIAGQGIAGDRYATGRGYYSGVTEWDAQITLIEQEPFDSQDLTKGQKVDPEDLRRNLVTTGVDLTRLIGVRFRIGDTAVLRGTKLWPPCSYIVRSTGKPEIFTKIGRKSGIGAEVLVSGPIRAGDPIVILTDGEPVG
ncbi:MOSC domain-containing protein [bacterium]|nr:MOSC domain-containing protein [bacterium]